uniref:ATP synthase subunit a n=1 Tax=Elateroidea sp. 8 KM-2017 TaxID=2219431 RepID=A0A346RHF7_9COLE|nr:ATP synthase F0 subunit 6 [Elateroidea sp. 8 KM-2017]
MMTNLFSSFDPTTSNNLALNWMSMTIILFIMPSPFWLLPSRLNLMFMFLYKNIIKETSSIMNKYLLNSNILFFTIFFIILVLNFSSLFPMIFPCTSQISLSLSLALPLWMSMMIFGWTKKYYVMMAHLVPQGTPKILMPFMVCIESISNLIRPITLSVRLSANMIAGHLLLTLIGSTGSLINSVTLIVLLITQLMLIILESAVSIIQSYVFTILATLYSSEI